MKRLAIIVSGSRELSRDEHRAAIRAYMLDVLAEYAPFARVKHGVLLHGAQQGADIGRMACRENAIAITKLEEALMWLQKRTDDREQRGVEGAMKP